MSWSKVGDYAGLPPRGRYGDSERAQERTVAVAVALLRARREAWREFRAANIADIPARGPKGSQQNRRRAAALVRLYHRFMREYRAAQSACDFED